MSDTATDSPGDSRGSSDEPLSDDAINFDRLIDDYCSVWCRLHPVASVDAGVYEFADRMRPYEDDDHAILVSLNERLIKGLEEIDASRMDADRALDHQLAFGGAYLELDGLKRHDWRHRDPQRFVPVDAIYQLLVRPVPNRIAALSARLQSLPEYLEKSTHILASHADQVSLDWLNNALTSLDSGRQFIGAASEHPQVLEALANDPASAERDSKRLMFLLAGANDALTQFQGFLEKQIAPQANGDFAAGEQRFTALLKYRHFLDADAASVRLMGESVVKQTQVKLKRLTQELSGSDDVLALAERLLADGVDARGLLPAYRQAIDAARRFVVDKDLMTIPSQIPLQIEQTPDHLRYFVPFSDYIAANSCDVDASARYLVTPVDEEDAIARHDHKRIRHMAVVDTWPGKHLQAMYTHEDVSSRSLIRILNASSTRTRGWGLYSEDLMFEQGFINGPEHDFLLLYNRLWRALGLVADVDLHTQSASVTDISDRLREQLGFTESQAEAEVTRYTRQATEAMGYVVGWAQIRAARELHNDAVPDFSLKQFHDQLLPSGPIAMSLGIEQAFGAERRSVVDQRLFG